VIDLDNAALIGHTGFVGGNLARQHKFEDCFNSSNIEAVAGRTFDLIVCAGVPSEKWKANAEPDRDRQNIGRLMAALVRVEAPRLVLISTVDVFKDPVEVDEDSPISTVGLQPYGRNRRHLEEFVASHFDASIVRLPGLYGTGLKKNAIFDLLNHNQVEKIDSRGVFQFYGVDRLWSDIEIVLNEALPVAHLVTEPVSMQEVARAAFDIDFRNEVAAAPPHYDLRTRYAELFGGTGEYVEPRDRVLDRIREYVAGERSTRG
jgi:nucleoside-diphosphate-sugar epimerase